MCVFSPSLLPLSSSVLCVTLVLHTRRRRKSPTSIPTHGLELMPLRGDSTVIPVSFDSSLELSLQVICIITSNTSGYRLSYVVRTGAAQLCDVLLGLGHVLDGVFACLGSMILDATMLYGPCIDFAKSNAHHTSALIDQAKLTANFKIKKQYPKLAMLGAYSK